METERTRFGSIVYTSVILAGTLLLAAQHFNQFYRVMVSKRWEGLPFAEGGRWFYTSPAFFGYYSLVQALVYGFLFGLGLYAVLKRRPQVFRMAGTIFLAFYLLTYLLQYI